MSNKETFKEELAEAVENGLRSFKESTDAARTVDPSGFDDPALYQDASGKGAQLGTLETPHDAAQNMATIQAKPSDAEGGGAGVAPKKKEEGEEEEEVKENTSSAEYLSQLFAENELSPELMEKLSTIFDAALEERIDFIQTEMQESFDKALNGQVETIADDLSEKLDDFLSYVVEEWTTDNQIAIERGIQSDIAESFLSGLKSLFEAHYIEMPDEKVKVVDELYTVKEDLEEQLNSQMERNIELTKALNVTAAQSIFATMCEELTDTEVERFAQLAETVEFEDYDQYSRKLQIVRESFLGNIASTESVSQESTAPRMLSEEVQHNGGTDNLMDAYTKAIGFQNRNK